MDGNANEFANVEKTKGTLSKIKDFRCAGTPAGRLSRAFRAVEPLFGRFFEHPTRFSRDGTVFGVSERAVKRPRAKMERKSLEIIANHRKLSRDLDQATRKD